MFYKHLHDPSCDLFMHGEEAPQSKEAQLQAALDAEREKVKELVANQAEYEKCTDEQITALNQGCLDYEKQIATLQAQVKQLDRTLADVYQQRDGLQAQLAAAKKVKADYDRWLSGGVYFTTAEYEKHVADYEQQVQALQAQLRQVEGERDEWERKCRDLCQAHGVLLIEHHDIKKELTTLRQLVEVAVQRWRAQTNAQEGISFKLAMKDLEAATLAAQDAKDAPLTDEQRAIRDCCEKPHDCKWGGLGGCGYEGRKP